MPHLDSDFDRPVVIAARNSQRAETIWGDDPVTAITRVPSIEGRGHHEDPAGSHGIRFRSLHTVERGCAGRWMREGGCPPRVASAVCHRGGRWDPRPAFGGSPGGGYANQQSPAAPPRPIPRCAIRMRAGAVQGLFSFGILAAPSLVSGETAQPAMRIPPFHSGPPTATCRFVSRPPPHLTIEVLNGERRSEPYGRPNRQ